MRCYVGVDGGTSRCTAALVDSHGKVMGRGTSGPIYAGDDMDHRRAAEHLREAIGGAIATAGVSHGDVACVYLACSNWYGESRRPDAESALGPLGLRARIVVSEHGDILSPWAAGGFPDPSIFITLGTFWGGGAWMDGSYRPHLLDQSGLDQTSGFWAQGETIGTTGLIAAIRSRLGGPPTSMYDKFCANLGAPDVPALAAWAAGHDAPRERAALARTVAEAAQEGDPAACAIYRRAAEGIAEAFAVQAHHMGLADRPIVCLLSGNTLKVGAPLLGPLSAALGALLPQAELRVNETDPSVGAALLALRVGG